MFCVCELQYWHDCDSLLCFCALLNKICNSDDLDEGRMKHKEFCAKRNLPSGASVSFHPLPVSNDRYFSYRASNCVCICRNGTLRMSWMSGPSWTPGRCRRVSRWSLWRSEVVRSDSVKSVIWRQMTPPSLKGKMSYYWFLMYLIINNKVKGKLDHLFFLRFGFH